jgi:hypothetical protein
VRHVAGCGSELRSLTADEGVPRLAGGRRGGGEPLLVLSDHASNKAPSERAQNALAKVARSLERRPRVRLAVVPG